MDKQSGIEQMQFHGQPTVSIGRDHPSLDQYIASIPIHWQLAFTDQASVGQAIERIWSPIIHRARGFTFRMVNMTLELRLVVSPPESRLDQLIYVSEQSKPMNGWFAGRPAEENELLGQEDRFGRSLPNAYKTFVRIHNGLLAAGSIDAGILPVNQLRIVPNPLTSTESLQTLPEKLLVFCKHRSGHSQAFDLSALIGSGDFLTVQIDQNSRVVREPESFWGFLKRFAIDFLK